MVLPTGASCFSEAMRMGSELYHHLKKPINKKFPNKDKLPGRWRTQSSEDHCEIIDIKGVDFEKLDPVEAGLLEKIM